MHQTNTKPNRDLSKLYLGLTLFLALLLRLYDLGKESYWVDEIFSVTESKQSIQQILMSGRLDQPPAYYIPFHYWVRVFGDAEISARAFSVLAGILSIILIYLIGKKLFSTNTGLVSALLMTLSVFQIAYSQEARFYIHFQLATLCSFLFLLYGLESKKRVYFFLYVIASILMLFSHTYGVFILFAQNLFVVLYNKKYRSLLAIWLTSQAVLALVFGIYLIYIFTNGTTFDSQIASGDFNLNAIDIIRTIYHQILPARRDRSWAEILPYYLVAFFLLLIGTGIYARGKGTQKFFSDAKESLTNIFHANEKLEKIALLSGWLLAPILLPFIVSVTISPMYRERYAICAAPALYLLLAFFISEFRIITPQKISLAAFVIMSVPGLQYYYTENLKEEWREATAYVEQNLEEKDLLVFAPSTSYQIQQRTFHWYYDGSTTDCLLNNDLISNTQKQEALTKCLSGHQRFWVISRIDSENPQNTYEEFFEDNQNAGLQLMSQKDFVGITVYLFDQDN